MDEDTSVIGRYVEYSRVLYNSSHPLDRFLILEELTVASEHEAGLKLLRSDGEVVVQVFERRLLRKLARGKVIMIEYGGSWKMI